MRVVVNTFLSLDGVMQGPGGPGEDDSNGFDQGGWLVPYFDDALGAFVGAGFASADALLLGRGTYDIFAAHWPNVTAEQDPGAVSMNELPRYVIGTPTEPVLWAGTTVLDGDAVQQITDLKARAGRDLLVSGSHGLIQTLLAASLVDELRLVIAPVLVGRGKRLFGDGTTPVGLELVELSTTSTGAILAIYRPAGPIARGTFAAG